MQTLIIFANLLLLAICFVQVLPITSDAKIVITALLLIATAGVAKPVILSLIAKQPLRNLPDNRKTERSS